MTKRTLSLLLALVLLLSTAAPLTQAASFEETYSAEYVSALITTDYNSAFLNIEYSVGTAALHARTWNYDTIDHALSGPAYCIDHGGYAPTDYVSVKTIRYTARPQTIGAFANGYPQLALEDFVNNNVGAHPEIAGLTIEEYGYATQVAVWATLGQIAVDGTSFSDGHGVIHEPVDAQQLRVFRAIQVILAYCENWTQILETGLHIRAEKNILGDTVDLGERVSLVIASERGDKGITKETINGTDYYTREFTVSSATPTLDGKISLAAEGAPSGTIFTGVEGTPLSSVGGVFYAPADTATVVDTAISANGTEYAYRFKLCIPADAGECSAAGSVTIRAGCTAQQYNIYTAYASNEGEQSFVLASPEDIDLSAVGYLKWGETTGDEDPPPEPTTASIRVLKTDGVGMPLAGATFTLVGDGGYTASGTSNASGEILWTDVPADQEYTLRETAAPEGYRIVDPVNVTVTAGQTSYVTVPNGTERFFRLRKLDAQNGYPLAGAVFRFEQIDGDFVTEGVTFADGIIQFDGAELPFGSYRVTEVSVPEGYEIDKTVRTVSWDGTEDVDLVFTNVRKVGFRILKVDSVTNAALGHAVFDIYKDGEYITTVTTNDAGIATVSGLSEGYYEAVEKSAPEGYVLDTVRRGIYLDPYDPKLEDDPVLVIENEPKPTLLIVKYDAQTGGPVRGVTFEVYRDTELLGSYTTDTRGQILLENLEPGTYLVKEVAAGPDYVVNSTPQQTELTAGMGTARLVFLNFLKPGMRLVKLDAQTYEPLAGAVFRVELVGGSFSREYTTDANGEIDLSQLEPGAYKVTELAAPEGYLVDTESRVIQLNEGETAQYVFTNTAKPVLVLMKYDPNTGKYLAGATFRIAKIEDGSHYLDRVTDAEGRIVLENLDPGVYSVQELAAPEGYILNTREYHVELFAGKESTIVVSNEAKPDLLIVKKDAQTGEKLSGASFVIRKADGETVSTVTTDKNGEALLENLDPGAYVVTEVSPPGGYLLNTEPQSITLTPNRTGTVVFENYPRPTLVIKKVDLQGNPLTGAIFEVRTKSGVKIGDFPVGADGTLTVPSAQLDEGYYIVTEIQAPEGYILDSTPREVYLRAGQTTEIVVENEKKPDLLIRKIDSVVGDGVAGAKFEIWTSSDNSEGSFKRLDSSYYYTDADGLIRLDGLDTGWYRIVEVEPPEGYMLKAPSEQTVYVDNDKSVEAVFENIPKSALVIRKVDGTDGRGLAGAWFRVRYLGGTSGTGGTVIGEYETSNSGSIVITGLDAGAYIVEEISAPDGYVTDSGAQTAYISGEEQAVVMLTFKNAPYGSLLIKKLDAATSEPLSDVQFFVTDSTGAVIGNSNGYYVTDSAGTILISGLAPGTTLVVKETRTREDYVLDDTPQTVKIQSGETVMLEFRNAPKGSLIIRKLDSITKKPLEGVQFKLTYSDGSYVDAADGKLSSKGLYTTDANGQILISGITGTIIVTEVQTIPGYELDGGSQTVIVNPDDTQTLWFYNTPYGSLTLTKVDSVTGKPIADVEFKISGVDGCEFPAGSYITDADGKIHLDSIPNGAYSVVETRAADGYILDSSVLTVKVQGGGHKQLTVRNTPLGGLVIKKMDATTMEPIAGVIFKVTTTDGAVVGTSNGEYRTDANGFISIPNIGPGSYIVRELKAADGYLLDDTPKTIVIKDGQTYTLEVFNAPITMGSLLIKKVDAVTNEPLSDVQFFVTDSTGAVIGNSNGCFVTDSAGTILISGLAPGTTLVVKETRTRDGYILDDTPQTVKIKDGETVALEFRNAPKGGLVIVKRDSVTGEPLEGVQFKVTYADGRVVDSANGRLSSNGLYFTDKYGQIRISGVVGTIVVTEVRTIPGYILDSTPQTVAVNPDDTQTLYFYNDPLGALRIIKTDADTGERISGVKFEVREMDGELIGTATTDRNGVVYLPSMESGWYTVTELEAADGYIPDPTPQNVEIVSGKVSTLEVENEKASSILIHKTDAVTGEGIYGVTFVVYDASGEPIEQLVTDQNGYAWLRDELTEGKYYIRELEPAEGYIADTEYKTVYVSAGNTVRIEWENMPERGQIQIVKKSADYNPTNGLPAGTLLEGAVFEIYDRAGNVVDSIRTDKNGRAVSALLPLGSYTVREVRAPEHYSLNPAVMSAALEYPGQIITFEMEDASIVTGVGIQKAGYNEVMPGQPIRYTVTGVANTSTVPLSSFYWRDVLPAQVTLTKLVTGTYSQTLTYKVVYRTNLSGESYRTLADNLSAQRSYTIDASPQTLGLAANERVTEIMYMFGVASAGFSQTEAAYIYGTVAEGLANGSGIVNTADAGGIYGGKWIVSVSRWYTQVYAKTIVCLPRTGY